MLSTAIIWDLLLWWYPFRRQKVVKEGNFVVHDDDGWILIENGSYNGYFDWIPIHLRIGKWSIGATIYFRFLWISAFVLVWYDAIYTSSPGNNTTVCMIDNTTISQSSSSSQPSMVEQQCTTAHAPLSHNNLLTSYLHHIVRRYWVQNANTILRMSPIVLGSTVWYYHTIIGIYMAYICYTIIRHSALSYGAWITYTVQSWTLLMIRHWLYTFSPLFDDQVLPTTTTTTTNSTQQYAYNNSLIVIAELIRFPCAVAHTITFVIWNFILVPYIVYVALRNEPKKQNDFIQFNTNFRLLNLHIMNIVFCLCNVWIFNTTTSNILSSSSSSTLSIHEQQSTSRTLEMADLYLAGISVLFYWTFYLCILDRIGIHLYPIFSPRHNNIIICFVWTSVIGLYILVFYLWQTIVQIDPKQIYLSIQTLIRGIYHCNKIK
jgi:hypothetical protein